MTAHETQRYLVELYRQNPDPIAAAAAARDALGKAVQITEVISIPEDELVFLVIDVPTREDLITLLQRGGLRVNRISQAQTNP